MLHVKPIIKRVKRSSFFSIVYKNFFYWCLRMLFSTYRLEVNVAPGVIHYFKTGKGIFYFWHQQLLAGMFFFFKQQSQGACIVSPSVDGKIAGFICQRLGFDVLYGSAHKSSISVTRQALQQLQGQGRLCLVGDGSRGPAFQLQPGLKYLALKSQKPLIFVECRSTQAITFSKSWDKFQIPLPFSRIIVNLHEPHFVACDV